MSEYFLFLLDTTRVFILPSHDIIHLCACHLICACLLTWLGIGTGVLLNSFRVRLVFLDPTVHSLVCRELSVVLAESTESMRGSVLLD